MAISSMMQNQLEDILSAGGSLEISAKSKMANQLADLARSAKRGGSQLTLTGVGSFMQNQLVEIARAGSGHVTFKD